MLHNQVETGQGALTWNICQLLRLELGRNLQHPTAARKPTLALLPHLRMPQPGTQAKDRKRPLNGPERQETDGSGPSGCQRGRQPLALTASRNIF